MKHWIGSFCEKAKRSRIGRFFNFNFVISLCFLLGVTLIFFVFIRIFSIDLYSLKENLASEIFGSFFDILIVFVLFNLLINLNQEKQLIKRYLEEIDDYKGWNASEALYRIMGVVKRLNRLNFSRIDLGHCFLNGAYLPGIDLRGGNLSGGCFDGAILTKGNFEKVIFYGASFVGANLRGAKLNDASLSAVNFTRTDLSQATLDGTDSFMGADFNGANLAFASLKGADLSGFNFTNTILLGADFENALNQTVEKFAGAHTLIQIKNLDPAIENKLKSDFPRLFNSAEIRFDKEPFCYYSPDDFPKDSYGWFY